MTNTATTPALAPLPPRFDLGQTVTTPGALDACSLEYMHQCLVRHMRGDWGCVCAEDGETNDQALVCGNRVLSSYPLDPAKPCAGWGNNTLWIITEADRSVTTFLLPEEY
jgi:hypothetical protein